MVGLGLDLTATQLPVQHPSDPDAPDLPPQPLLLVRARGDGPAQGCVPAGDAGWPGLAQHAELHAPPAPQVATSDGVLRFFTFGWLGEHPGVVAPPQPLPPAPAVAPGSAAESQGSAGAAAGAEEAAAATALPDEESDFEVRIQGLHAALDRQAARRRAVSFRPAVQPRHPACQTALL